MDIIEPIVVSPESEFEHAIIAVAKEILRVGNVPFFLISRFGLDATFFNRSKLGISVKMFEFKCYAGGRRGGIGFGTAKGLGPQVELLKKTESELEMVFPIIRWILVDALLPIGSKRYAIVDSVIAKKSAMGEVRAGKQNNFRLSAFKPYMIDWPNFVRKIEQFLIFENQPEENEVRNAHR